MSTTSTYPEYGQFPTVPVEDLERIIGGGGGGTGLPEVTTDDNGKFLGVQEGEWAKADAPSGGTYDVPFEITGLGTQEQAISTAADFDDFFAAHQKGKVTRAKVALPIDQGNGTLTIYIPLVATADFEQDEQTVMRVARFQVCTDMENVPTLVSISWYSNPQISSDLTLTPLAAA